MITQEQLNKLTEYKPLPLTIYPWAFPKELSDHELGPPTIFELSRIFNCVGIKSYDLHNEYMAKFIDHAIENCPVAITITPWHKSRHPNGVDDNIWNDSDNEELRWLWRQVTKATEIQREIIWLVDQEAAKKITPVNEQRLLLMDTIFKIYPSKRIIYYMNGGHPRNPYPAFELIHNNDRSIRCYETDEVLKTELNIMRCNNKYPDDSITMIFSLGGGYVNRDGETHKWVWDARSLDEEWRQGARLIDYRLNGWLYPGPLDPRIPDWFDRFEAFVNGIYRR